ncbi:MAG: hypothetical protein ACXWCU_01765 [Caldimonas sp.]
MLNGMTLERRYIDKHRALPLRATAHALTGLAAAVIVASCGGGGGNPFDNPASVSNPDIVSGQHLAFAYFQRCINPIFNKQLAIVLNGQTSTNTCSASGCHDTVTGTGGALRLIGSAQEVDLSDPAMTPAAIRATDMYKNFYSAQGEVVLGSPVQSKLLDKPLLLGVLHGGGLIFPSQSDSNALLIQYWISHPAPQGADEFSAATYAMFTPPDPKTGTCNTQ